MWKLYMMPGSQSLDPDPVWIRIRPDSELLDPAGSKTSRSGMDSDLKIVDPVHP